VTSRSSSTFAGPTRQNAISREGLAALGITPTSVAENLAAGRTRGWVCAHESRLVGFCIAQGSSGEVLVLAVLPDFEGRGYGRRQQLGVDHRTPSSGVSL
jgi:ribosomal protein S18 acetylase RimI-like enzyme